MSKGYSYSPLTILVFTYILRFESDVSKIRRNRDITLKMIIYYRADLASPALDHSQALVPHYHLQEVLTVHCRRIFQLYNLIRLQLLPQVIILPSFIAKNIAT